MPALREPMNLGDLLKYEAPSLYSRDTAPVAPGQTLSLGTVVARMTPSGELTALDPAATEGSEIAVGVLLAPVNTAATPAPGVFVARHAIVSDHAMSWPVAMTPAQQAAAINQLRALGVLVRTGA